MDKKLQEDFLWGTLIGTVLGAATALLLTPTSGTRLRQRVVNQLQSLNGKLLGENTHARTSRSSSKSTARAKSAALHHHKMAAVKKTSKRTRAR